MYDHFGVHFVATLCEKERKIASLENEISGYVTDFCSQSNRIIEKSRIIANLEKQVADLL